MTLHVLFEVGRRLELLFAGLAGVDSDARQLFAVLLQVQGELALQDKLISAFWTDQILQAKRGQPPRGVMLSDRPAPLGSCWADWLTNLLLLMQHDMGFEAGNAGEPFVADRAGEVGCCVRGLVEREVKFHVKRLRAVVTSVRLPRTDHTLPFCTGCVLICSSGV